MTAITRSNIDALLDFGTVQVQMTSGNWWTIRRNGKTKTWKRDPRRVYIPFKCGFKVCGSITELDFNRDGTLSKSWRVNPLYADHAAELVYGVKA